MANFLITYVLWWYLSIQSEIDHILKLKQRFSKCTVIMRRDHGHPYILSTTILSDLAYLEIDCLGLFVVVYRAVMFVVCC